MSHGQWSAARISAGLNTRRIGRRVHIFGEIDSTNRFVLDGVSGASEAVQDGDVVLAEFQTGGRGRFGRNWHCPRGAGILCTLALRDVDRQIDPQLLALVAPIALVDGIFEACAVRAEIKWPNDLVVQRRKLAGVLIESRPGPGGGVWYALGFGINCLQHRGHFPPDLRPRATSLDLECPASIDRTAVLQHVLHELDRWTAAPETWDPAAICARWREHSLPLGSRISILHEGTVFVGQVVDIDPTAALLVELDQGVRRLFPAAGCTIVD